MGGDKGPRPAYVVDLDENGRKVRGTVRSATKEKPTLSQRESRPGHSSKKSHSDTGPYGGEKSTTRVQAVEVVTEKDTKPERRKSTSGSVKSPRKSGRPPSSHENRGFPKPGTTTNKSKKDDPAYFGRPSPTFYAPPVVSQPLAVPIPMRPRAITTQTYPSRPLSYHQTYSAHGQYAPPLSSSAFYAYPQVITPSYPPPSPSYMRYAVTPQPTTQADYFAQPVQAPIARPLTARFDIVPRSAQVVDPISRTTSAFGPRDSRRLSFSESYEGGYYEDSYASRASDPIVRRRESSRDPPVQRRDDPDTRAMPPPPRPRPILRRPATDYPADRPSGRAEYQDPPDTVRYRNDPSPRRPNTKRNSVSYDLGQDSARVRVEPSNNSRHRESYYGQSTSSASNGYEDKLHQAASYQQDVGGPSIPLTAEILKKQQRRQGGSSRSTKSSGSRDESDYRKSATTRTTRSGSGNDDENVTIKVTGQARVMVGGAQIDCNEGGEIRIERQKSIRNGSEWSNSDYGGPKQIDDRRSRVDRPNGHSRMSSQHSYHRATPYYPMDNAF